MSKPTAQSLIQHSWKADDTKVSDLTSKLQTILDKLTVEEAKHLDDILDLAYEKGADDEAENQCE